MAELFIPTTLQEYTELSRYLDGVKTVSMSKYQEIMRYYSLKDLFFFINFVGLDGKHPHSTYGTPFFFHQFYLDECKKIQWQLDNLESSFNGSSRRGGKSTMRTKYASIQMALKYPNIAINISSVEKGLADRHLYAIKSELEENLMLKVLFEDRLYMDPQNAAHNGETIWSMSKGLRIKTSTSGTNNTFETNNFLTGATGSGYDIIHFDDCENGKQVSNSDNLTKLHESFDAMVKVATPKVLRRPIFMITNTFYHPEGIAMRKYLEYKKQDERKVSLYPAEDRSQEGSCPGGGVACYPFTEELLNLYYTECKDKDDYYIQYCCDFQTGQDRRFKRDWLSFYDEDQRSICRGKNGYLCIDASRGVYDPMGIWGWAAGIDKKLYWVDGSRKKLDPASPAFADEIFIVASRMSNLCDRLVEIRVEQMYSQTWAELIAAELQKRGMYVNVVPCKGKLLKDSGRRFANTKMEREWQRWSPALQRGEIVFPRPSSMGGKGMPTVDEHGKPFDLVDHYLSFEYDLFPRAPHDDLMDAACLIWEPEATPIIYPFPKYRRSTPVSSTGGVSWRSA